MKVLDEKYFEEFQLVNSNSGKQYAGISEKDVTAKEIQTLDKTGKPVVITRLYINNKHIASIDKAGKVRLTEDYKSMLKNEKSYGENGEEIVGERWIQAMVPVSERNKGKEIEEMQTRKAIERINMEERIKEEDEKRNKDKVNGVDSKLQATPEGIEKDLNLKSGDIEVCTVIQDKRFYDNIVEAQNMNGFAVLAYSKSKSEFMILGVDESTGKCKKLDTINPSIYSSEETTNVRYGEVSNKGVQYVMDVKGNDELAYSVRIDPGSAEVEFHELRKDLTEQGNNKYIATELVTTMQRPSEQEVEAFKKENNPNISDEKEVIKEYEKVGIKVTRIEAITENERTVNEILTMQEVREKIKSKPEYIQESIIYELEGMEAHELTKQKLSEIIQEKEYNNQRDFEEEEKTPWGDAEARRLRR